MKVLKMWRQFPIGIQIRSINRNILTPSRVILQDFTGVPAVVDLATMRDAVVSMQGNPNDINPLSCGVGD